MKSVQRGKTTLAAEVTNISRQGIWLLLDERELFLSYRKFPWFRDARLREILDVRRPRPDHLRWPALDVDLHLDSIEHPDRYPLRSRSGNGGVIRERTAVRRRTQASTKKRRPRTS